MTKEIAFIGIDVDDKAYHVSGVSSDGEAITSFASRGTVNRLAKDLKKKFGNYKMNVCYEASYTGYSQARILKKHGISCAVIHHRHSRGLAYIGAPSKGAIYFDEHLSSPKESQLTIH